MNSLKQIEVVAAVGLEPTLSCPNGILNPACLPISPRRHTVMIDSQDGYYK